MVGAQARGAPGGDVADTPVGRGDVAGDPAGAGGALVRAGRHVADAAAGADVAADPACTRRAGADVPDVAGGGDGADDVHPGRHGQHVVGGDAALDRAVGLERSDRGARLERVARRCRAQQAAAVCLDRPDRPAHGAHGPLEVAAVDARGADVDALDVTGGLDGGGDVAVGADQADPAVARDDARVADRARARWPGGREYMDVPDAAAGLDQRVAHGARPGPRAFPGAHGDRAGDVPHDGFDRRPERSLDGHAAHVGVCAHRSREVTAGGQRVDGPLRGLDRCLQVATGDHRVDVARCVDRAAHVPARGDTLDVAVIGADRDARGDVVIHGHTADRGRLDRRVGDRAGLHPDAPDATGGRYQGGSDVLCFEVLDRARVDGSRNASVGLDLHTIGAEVDDGVDIPPSSVVGDRHAVDALDVRLHRRSQHQALDGAARPARHAHIRIGPGTAHGNAQVLKASRAGQHDGAAGGRDGPLTVPRRESNRQMADDRRVGDDDFPLHADGLVGLQRERRRKAMCTAAGVLGRGGASDDDRPGARGPLPVVNDVFEAVIHRCR